MLPLALTLAWFVTGYILAQWTLLLNRSHGRRENDSIFIATMMLFSMLTSCCGPFWLVGLVIELRRTHK